MNITKEEVLKNIEEVKKFVSEIKNEKKEETVIGIAIKNRWTGSIIFQSTKTIFKDAVLERLASDANLSDANLSGADLSGANLSDANLSGADLSDANLSGAELHNSKFYGRGGTKELKREQLPAFLAALGFVIVD